MDAYMQPLILFHLFIIIIRQKKKKFGEIKKSKIYNLKNFYVKSAYKSGFFVCLCVDYIFVFCCVVVYAIVSGCV